MKPSPMSIGARFRDAEELERLISNLSATDKLSMVEKFIATAKRVAQSQTTTANYNDLHELIFES